MAWGVAGAACCLLVGCVELTADPIELPACKALATDDPWWCAADVDSNGTIDITDQAFLLQRFTGCLGDGDPLCEPSDVNEDGIIDCCGAADLDGTGRVDASDRTLAGALLGAACCRLTRCVNGVSRQRGVRALNLGRGWW